MTDKTHPEEIVMSDGYVGKNRRKAEKTIEQLELDILRMFEQFESRHRQLIREMREEMLGGFPNGDIAAHREYHESKVRAAQAEEAFWRAAKSEALKQGVTGVFAVLKLVGALAILGLAYKVGLGPAAARVFGVAP